MEAISERFNGNSLAFSFIYETIKLFAASNPFNYLPAHGNIGVIPRQTIQSGRVINSKLRQSKIQITI